MTINNHAEPINVFTPYQPYQPYHFDFFPQPHVNGNTNETVMHDPERGVTIVQINVNGLVYTGSSKTSPEDTFDFVVGLEIARARAIRAAARDAVNRAETIAGEAIFNRPRRNRRKDTKNARSGTASS